MQQWVLNSCCRRSEMLCWKCGMWSNNQRRNEEFTFCFESWRTL